MNKTATITVLADHALHTFVATLTREYVHCGHTFYEYAMPADAPLAVRSDYARGFTSVPAIRVRF